MTNEQVLDAAKKAIVGLVRVPQLDTFNRFKVAFCQKHGYTSGILAVRDMMDRADKAHGDTLSAWINDNYDRYVK